MYVIRAIREMDATPVRPSVGGGSVFTALKVRNDTASAGESVAEMAAQIQ